MKPGGRLRELIPVLLAVVLVASFLALIFELVIASARGVPLDPVATPVLGGITAACIPALAGFWAIESKPRQEPPDDRDSRAGPYQGRHTWIERTGDEDSDEWNRDHGYLEVRKVGRWKPCSAS